MKEQDIQAKLYGWWEDGIIPSNYTEDHEDYEDAVRILRDKMMSEEELITSINQGYRLFHPDL